MKVIVYTERVRSHKKAADTAANKIRMARLLKAAKRDPEKHNRIKRMSKSLKDRAKFLRTMYSGD